MLRSAAALVLIASTLGATGAYAILLPDECASPVNEMGGGEDDDCERSCLLCACCLRQPLTIAGAAPLLGALLLPAGVCVARDPSLPPPLPSEILHIPKLS